MAVDHVLSTGVQQLTIPPTANDSSWNAPTSPSASPVPPRYLAGNLRGREVAPPSAPLEQQVPFAPILVIGAPEMASIAEPWFERRSSDAANGFSFVPLNVDATQFNLAQAAPEPLILVRSEVSRNATANSLTSIVVVTGLVLVSGGHVHQFIHAREQVIQLPRRRSFRPGLDVRA